MVHQLTRSTDGSSQELPRKGETPPRDHSLTIRKVAGAPKRAAGKSLEGQPSPWQDNCADREMSLPSNGSDRRAVSRSLVCSARHPRKAFRPVTSSDEPFGAVS